MTLVISFINSFMRRNNSFLVNRRVYEIRDSREVYGSGFLSHPIGILLILFTVVCFSLVMFISMISLVDPDDTKEDDDEFIGFWMHIEDNSSIYAMVFTADG